jgi:hypothetical protein
MSLPGRNSNPVKKRTPLPVAFPEKRDNLDTEKGGCMQKTDWVSVGIKLLGIYIGVLALIGAGSVLLGTVIQLLFRGDTPFKAVFIRLLAGLIQPLVQGAVAWMLLKRTGWCLRKIGIGEEPPQM